MRISISIAEASSFRARRTDHILFIECQSPSIEFWHAGCSQVPLGLETIEDQRPVRQRQRKEAVLPPNRADRNRSVRQSAAQFEFLPTLLSGEVRAPAFV